MTALVWDQMEDRWYETGIERGVLYRVNGGEGDAFPWNGLVSVTEAAQLESKSYYYEGLKVLERSVAGSYSAKISAFTYPDFLDDVVGIQKYAPGVNLHDQRPQRFHLSYRTRIGNSLDGPDAGYKVHFLYELSAVPDDAAINTLSDKVEPTTFGWTVTGMQKRMLGDQPISHISLDSRNVDPAILAELESYLYGKVDDYAFMPDADWVLSFFA